MTDTRERLATMVEQLLGSDKPITDDSLLVDDHGADSLDIVELVIEIEDAFSIEIDDEEWPHSPTFASVVALVTSKLV